MPGRPANCAGSSGAQRRRDSTPRAARRRRRRRRDHQALGQHLLHQPPRDAPTRGANRRSLSVAPPRAPAAASRRSRRRSAARTPTAPSSTSSIGLHVADQAHRAAAAGWARDWRSRPEIPAASRAPMIRRSSRALCRRHAVAQPADRLEEVRRAQRAIVIVQRQRHDDVRTRRPPETRRQHADDLERPAVERDGAADDGRIGAEAAPPQPVAEQRRRDRGRRFLLRRGSRVRARA